MFTAITEAPWHTPDCVIECTWPELTREFVRSRALNSTGPLPGIRLFSPTHPSGREWKSADPPFPPVCVPAFQDRFVRFHGGAVADSASRGILILGESGYGKSTMCNQLVRNHGFRLLTDEDVFVHRRGRTVEPFPVGHALEKNGGKGIWELISQPTMIAPSAATIEQILVLRAPGTAVEALSRVNVKALLTALLEGQRPGGSSHAEAMATILLLARSVPAVEAAATYPQLLKLAPHVATLLPSVRHADSSERSVSEDYPLRDILPPSQERVELER
jgi:hypothetical protein